MKLTTPILVAAACILMSGCETAKVIQKISDDRTAGRTGTSSQPSGFVRTNNFVGSLTDEQIASIDKHLDNRGNENPALTKARTQSRELVKYVHMRTACALQQFQMDIRFSDGPVYLPSPRIYSDTAPKNICYSVVRITGWKMPTLNTLQFCTDYGSELSGEGRRLCTELISNDGETWLVRGNIYG